MKIAPALLIFILVFSSCKKSANKDETNTGEFCLDTTFLHSNISEGLHSIFFLNGKDGFVSGSNGGIYKTTDSAKSWTQQNSTTNLPVRDLFFIDAMQGFAVGGENSCSGTGCIIPGGFILRTIDGGNTWAKVFTPSQKIEISSVYFITSSMGFCVGDNVIMKTTDGGQTWSEKKIDNLGGKMMEVKFVTQQKGYIVCLFDKIVKTEDGGLSWLVTSPNRGSGYYSISEANGATYVSGQGKMIKSINGGSSWTELSNSPGDIFAIHFINDKTGFAFGRGNYSGGDFGRSYGSIYCTVNGGAAWNGTADVKEAGLIIAVSFPASNLAYAVSGNTIIRLLAK
jgi:photosystem II stability/assembly factor-like uncharacterized protein